MLSFAPEEKKIGRGIGSASGGSQPRMISDKGPIGKAEQAVLRAGVNAAINNSGIS
jgi:hypothetical protein